jgi:hypothetical protein
MSSQRCWPVGHPRRRTSSAAVRARARARRSPPRSASHHSLSAPAGQRCRHEGSPHQVIAAAVCCRACNRTGGNSHAARPCTRGWPCSPSAWWTSWRPPRACGTLSPCHFRSLVPRRDATPTASCTIAAAILLRPLPRFAASRTAHRPRPRSPLSRLSGSGAPRAQLRRDGQAADLRISSDARGSQDACRNRSNAPRLHEPQRGLS